MKKIVIAMLLLLPLIIVASVLVATSVISNEAYIAVERVDLNVDTSKTMVVGLSKGEFQLHATVYPTGAKNRSVIWSVENAICFGDEIPTPVTIDDTGLLRFYTYCSFDAVVTTVEGNKTARCNFVVKPDVLNGVSIAAERTDLRTGDRLELSLVLDPVDAEVSEATWTSSDVNVLEVDGNGIVNAVGVGSATVTLRVGELTATKEFTVTRGATVYGSNFSLSQGSVSIASLQPAGEVTAVRGATIDGENLTFVSDTAILNIGGETVTITRCGYDEIRIRNADFLEPKIWYLGKIPPYIAAEWADASKTDSISATYLSDNELVAKIGADGRVEMIAKGAVRFRAVVGSAEAATTLEFVKAVDYVRLDTVDAEDRRGIAAENLFGTASYDENGAKTAFRYEVKIKYPDDADWSDFDLSVSDTGFAAIDGHTVVITGSAEERRNLTVSVTAHYSAYASVQARANRNLTFIDGVNCENYSDVARAAESGENVVLRNNITAVATDGTVYLKGDLYGNGYMIDAVAMEKTDSLMPILKIAASDVTISNVIVRGDDVAKINMSNGMSSTAVWAGDEDEDFISNVRVEYSILENCYYAMAMTRVEIIVDGCIMRNTSNFGMFVPSKWRLNGIREYVYSDVVVNNCIMSNIVATAIGLHTQSKDGNKPLEKQSSFKQTGFLDIYNWQDVTAMRMLDRELIEGAAEMNDFLKRMANSAISNEIKKDEYASIRAETDEGTLLHLGMVVAGATHPTTVVPEFEDSRFVALPLTVLDTLEPLYHLDRVTLYLYENTADIGPDATFSEDAVTYARLRGK